MKPSTQGSVKLSVILPTYNEMQLGLYPQTLSILKRAQMETQTPSEASVIEILVVDRESQDQTPDLAKEQGFQLISTSKKSRAARLNIGLSQAKGQMLLLHHPRSLLSVEAIKSLVEPQSLPKPTLRWGGFSHQFDWDHPLLRFTSWYSNRIRGQLSGIIYLDHCIFFDRELLSSLEGPAFVPEVEIFEDTLLSQKLLNLAGRPLILPHISQTSALRFQKKGVYRQALLNQALKVGFHLNFPNTWMNRIYEHKLWLNSD